MEEGFLICLAETDAIECRENCKEGVCSGCWILRELIAEGKREVKEWISAGPSNALDS
jgi:hypothetical protein